MAKKKCATKNCENEFIQYNSLTKYCIPCAIKLAKPKVQKDIVKKEKERKKELKEKLTDHKKVLQDLINKIARLIDYGHNCVSCNNQPKKANGAHFHSVGANRQLRYNLLNIYIGCYSCNGEKGGNVHGYDDGIIREFGKEFWEFLKFDIRKKYPRVQLKEYQIKEAIITAREIVKELESDLIKNENKKRIELRQKYNKIIGIY